jgi:[acyl-carrier-protein] S-malonyltransferase
MSGMGIQTYVEVGSGEVLLGLIKRIDAKALRIALGTPSNFSALES